MDITLTPLAISTIPIVILLVSLLKKYGMRGIYAPLASIVFGIAFQFLLKEAWNVAILQGILVGLSSSGVYSGTKKMVGK